MTVADSTGVILPVIILRAGTSQLHRHSSMPTTYSTGHNNDHLQLHCTIAVYYSILPNFFVMDVTNEEAGMSALPLETCKQ